MIHRVKAVSIVSEAEIDDFLEFFCFFYDPEGAGNVICGSSNLPASNIVLLTNVHSLPKASLLVLNSSNCACSHVSTSMVS